MASLIGSTSIFQDLINILPKLDNKFSFLAFLFLACIAAIALVEIDKWLKSLVIGSLVALTGFAFYKYLESGLELVREQSLVRLVKDQDRVKIGDDIEVGLEDVESLEGKDKSTARDYGGIEYNCLELPRYVMEGVFRIARVRTTEDICKLSQKDWESYLSDLDTSGEIVKDTPFAKLNIFLNGKLLKQSNTWLFRNSEISIGGVDPVKLKVVHIYNTKERTTGEPEAVELKIMTK